MSKWITLTKAGGRSERVAINLDQATSMVQAEHKTRIQFGQADAIEVVEPITEILGQVEARRDQRN